MVKSVASERFTKKYKQMSSSDDAGVSQALELLDGVDELMANRFVLGEHHLSIAVMDEDGRRLDPDVVGEFRIRSPGAMLGYLHRQWKRLTLFLDDGRIELTNNRVERELRRRRPIGHPPQFARIGDHVGRRGDGLAHGLQDLALGGWPLNGNW